jgi:carboxypeptidase C (cathepsin A)
MSIDFSQTLSADSLPAWNLLAIVEVQTQNTSFESPQLRNFRSSLDTKTEATEIQVRTNSPIPIRALSPVLHAGSVVITESEQIGENLYKFWAFEPNRLEDEAPISLSLDEYS